MIRKLIVKNNRRQTLTRTCVTAALVLFIITALVMAVLAALGIAPTNVGGTLVTALAVALLSAPLVCWLVVLPANKGVQNLLQGPIIDEETRTLNQRGIIITLLELMAMAERYDNDLSVALVKLGDVDKLDDATRSQFMAGAADVVAEALRMPDRLGRYDSDSFLMILPETNQANADLVSGRIIESLRNNGVRLSEDKTVKPETFAVAATQYVKGEDLASITERIEGLLAKSAPA